MGRGGEQYGKYERINNRNRFGHSGSILRDKSNNKRYKEFEEKKLINKKGEYYEQWTRFMHIDREYNKYNRKTNNRYKRDKKPN